jgi:hypothetical protein
VRSAVSAVDRTPVARLARLTNDFDHDARRGERTGSRRLRHGILIPAGEGGFVPRGYTDPTSAKGMSVVDENVFLT